MSGEMGAVTTLAVWIRAPAVTAARSAHPLRPFARRA